MSVSGKQFGDGVLRHLATVTGIDGLATGTTTLYTVPTGKTLVAAMYHRRVTAATAVTVAPVAGVGVAGGEDDVIASALLAGLTSAGVGTLGTPKAGAYVPVGGDAIKLGIDVAGTGTTLTLAVDVLGMLV